MLDVAKSDSARLEAVGVVPPFKTLMITTLARNAVEIAEVLTYINNSFGNKLGVVTTNEVDADLAQCK